MDRIRPAQKLRKAINKSTRIKLALSEFELHPDRLSTTDAKGKRLFVFPADVRGYFRARRMRVQGILIAFFLLLPWLRIQGRQALLLDISQRRFEIFGLSLRAHNAPLLIFVFATAAFGLFFATTVFGRVWCGWACPQTVFIDGVFRRIERWIEGPALERRKMARAPLSFQKLTKKTIKWAFFIAATLIITHSFLAYFVGTDRLEEMILRPPQENWGSFLFMAISSAVILFDFAWFREQFCTIVCPYGRFQSVLMDKGSMIVAYDSTRGEPRATPQAKVLSKSHNTQLGDCVNCYRCVQVCPTGIDIRRGLQMECIACTSCIDACDDVMTKLKKPTGLIRYDSLLSKSKLKIRFSFRALLYLFLCIASIVALSAGLYLIKPVDVEILRAKDAPYTVQTLENGTVAIINHFKLELSNQSGAKHDLVFSISSPTADTGVKLITAIQPLPISDGSVIQTDIFIQFPKMNLKNGQAKVQLTIKDKNEKTDHIIEIEREVTLVGPFF
jgi:cytochrome c oxidase accessory protein FixG